MRPLILLLFLLTTVKCPARNVDDSVSVRTDKKESYAYLFSDTIIPIPKRPWLAAGEVFGVNVGLWAFDRYALKGDYAYISMNSIERNLRKGFHWDNDNFRTNLFNHPYHGAVYHNSARSNGMNFWEAGLYNTAGSLMWELFMECELPSTNDLTATSIGGMALGESLFRFSDLIFDNRTEGLNRFGREAIGLLVSPGRGLTRLLTGEAWKKSTRSGKQFTPKEMYLEIGSGIRFIELFELLDDSNELLDEGLGTCLDLYFEYGDLYDDESTTPYDYFSMDWGFILQKHQPFIGRINLLGRLYSRNIFNKKGHELYAGFFQHFDYYDSDTLSINKEDGRTLTPFEVGTPASAGFGLFHRWTNKQKTWEVRSSFHLNGIFLGSSLSDYYRQDERKYNWGSGFSVKFGAEASWKRRLFTKLHITNYRIFTWEGYDPDLDWENVDYKTLNVQGDKSIASYSIMHSRLAYRTKHSWEIAYTRYDYFRKTIYRHLPDVTSNATDERLSLVLFF